MANAPKLFDFSMRDILYVVFRHKGKILLVTLLVLAGVTAYTYLVPELYTSEAQVFVRLGRESLGVDPTISGPTTAMLTNREAEVRSEVAILKNRSLFEKLLAEHGESALMPAADTAAAGGIKGIVRQVRKGVRGAVNGVLYALDLKTKLEPQEEAIVMAMDNLDVEVERNTSILTVKYDAYGAELAQQTLTQLMQLYLAEHIDVHASLAGPEFFEQRADELASALAAAEAELDQFRVENKIVHLQSQKDALLERINSVIMDSRNVKAERDGSKARLASLEEALAKTSERHNTEIRTMNVNPVRDNLKQVVAELEIQEAEMAALYPDTHRPLQMLRDQIARTNATIDAEEKSRTEVVSAIDTKFQDLSVAVAEERAQYMAKQAAFDSLGNTLEEAQSELDRLAGLETELSRLERNVDVAATEYRDYRGNVKRSKINAALDAENISNLSIVQQPTRPVEPSYPNKLLNIGLGILVGLFSGLLLAFLLDYLDDSLNTTDQAERRLGVPVLAALSKEDYDACT
ncbi:MAG: hypothetical protein GC168_04100 [Candidatus Hydrogenedens sp.]|nr:hypothetical protein [Candidatus Hydrogenedens sp.]